MTPPFHNRWVIESNPAAAGEIARRAVPSSLRSLGWPGAVGLAALIIALGLERGMLAPLEARIEALQSDAARESRERSRSATAKAQADLPRARLRAFYAFFDRPERATEHLALIYALAQKLGVSLVAGEYKLAERDAQGGVRPYTVTLPVSGTYAQIRALAANILQEISVASLDRVEFKRRGNEPQTVEATLEFTLFLKAL